MAALIYRHPTDFGAFAAFCKRAGMKWLEDGAESHGVLYEGRALASVPNATVYSFFVNKVFSTGEGGMICTNDETLAYLARLKKNLGFKPGGSRNYLSEVVGYNYRLTIFQGAIGCAQTEPFELVARRRNAALYSSHLKTHESYLLLPTEMPCAQNYHWMYGIVLKESVGCTRDEFTQKLHDRDIDSRSFLHPMYLQHNLRPTKGSSSLKIWDSEVSTSLPAAISMQMKSSTRVKKSVKN